MKTHSIYVKNMVCNRCIMVVENALKQTGLNNTSVSLGEVKISQEPSAEQIEMLDALLTQHGFERIDDKKSRVLEQIKASVIHTIHHHDRFDLTINWSHFLSEKIGYDYGYLSHLFSTVTGTTLEQYIIKQKIEKVKEYLFYDELSVKEIAYKMGYSSVAHLSSQFKKVTGLTPTAFKALRKPTDRKSLDHIL